jgi:hypothetical protein
VEIGDRRRDITVWDAEPFSEYVLCTKKVVRDLGYGVCAVFVSKLGHYDV